MQDITIIINNTLESIKYFLIDDTIIINPNETLSTKIYKNIIKYRKLISLILLIALITCAILERDILFPQFSFSNYKTYLQKGGEITTTPPKPKDPRGKFSKFKKISGKGLKGIGKGASFLGKKGYRVGAAGFQMFRENATSIYQYVFIVGFLFIIGLIFFPLIVTLIISFICYILFKNFMKSAKAL